MSIRLQYLKTFNCVETIAIQVCKDISSNLFNNKITYKFCKEELMLKGYHYIAILETI